MELLDRNTVVRRVEGSELARERPTIELSAPPAMSGQVVVHIGPEDKRTSTGVSSILMYTAKRARAHFRR